MKRFDTGLVVGKFCPLHRGHQWLLDQARLQCDRLVVISYTRPEFAGCEPELRERWLASLYPDAVRLVLDDERLAGHCRRLGIAPTRLPDNDAPDDVHRRFVAWLLEVLLRVQVDVVFTSEAYGDGFAAALTTLQHARSGPPVVHVSVDPERGVVPVSGTAIRADVHGLRHLLDPLVYRDFVRRVAILGGESTGKSMLAAQLADRLATVHAAEYGRELWERKCGALTHADMLCIARTQILREEDCALVANRWVICDTTPLTTMLYSQVMFVEVADELEALARRPYDIVFLCAPDVPFVQDGTRRDESFRSWQHEWYLRELNTRGVRYRLLQGNWQSRIATAAEYLAAESATSG
jgi:HTH-type transcriptional regulator, transcriptional repressor of NAD biosynthesis genes